MTFSTGSEVVAERLTRTGVRCKPSTNGKRSLTAAPRKSLLSRAREQAVLYANLCK